MAIAADITDTIAHLVVKMAISIGTQWQFHIATYI